MFVDKPLLAGPAGLQLIPTDDPTGNGQESYEIAHRAPGSETLIYSRMIVQRYAGGKLRFVRCGPWAGTDSLFLLAGDGKVEVVEG